MSERGLRIDALARAAEAVGGGSKLAEILGLTRQAIYQWRQVPAERLVEIEEATGGRVTREELRPDLYRKAS